MHKYFSVDWAVVWQISREEVPVLEEQAMDIMRAEFPELAKTYEPETVVEPGPDERQSPARNKRPDDNAIGAQPRSGGPAQVTLKRQGVSRKIDQVVVPWLKQYRVWV